MKPEIYEILASVMRYLVIARRARNLSPCFLTATLQIILVLVIFFFCFFQALYDFVFCDEESPAEFVLVSNFPRKVYALDSASEHQTLEDAGIETNAMLFVQNVEEESDSD